MRLEKTPSAIQLTCMSLLDVRVEIEETQAVQQEDVQAIIGVHHDKYRPRLALRGMLSRSKNRARATRVYTAGFDSHSTRLEELHDAEAELVEALRAYAHDRLLASRKDYCADYLAMQPYVLLLRHIDSAAMLGRRASELITRAQTRFEYDVANGKHPSKASTEPYIWAANTAIDRLVTELHRKLTPLLRNECTKVEPWSLLPEWDDSNNRVGHSKRYHLVGWCLQHGHSFTHPQKGLVTGINLADKRLREYRVRYRAAKTVHANCVQTAQDSLIEKWLELTKAGTYIA